MKSRGMVLLTVLWILAVIAFIAFALAAAVRTEVNAAANSFDSERALFMAKGAAEVVFRKLQDPDAFPDLPVQEVSGIYTFEFGSGEVRVQPESDRSRIDLNEASEKVLTTMFDSLGVGEAARNELVDSILDWRDSDDVPRLHGAEVDDYGQVFLSRGRLPYNAPFKSLQEVLLVKHMTPAIYFGHVEFDTAANGYRKVRGLRDIATVSSGSKTVSVNAAPAEVFAALPGISTDLAAGIVAERERKRFADSKDLVTRIPELNQSPALDYLTSDSGSPTVLTATATIKPSGTTKTMRLHFKRERVRKIRLLEPLIYTEIEVLKFENLEF